MTSTASPTAPVDSLPVAERLRSPTGLSLSLVSFLFVVAIGQADGGYFPTAWGWCALTLAWIAAIAFIVGAGSALGRLELVFLGSLLLLVGWTALSISWSSDVEQSVLEVQRALVYLVGVLAALLVVRRRSVSHLLAGLLAGICVLSVHGLATRLFPASGAGFEEITLNRLAAPIGYANALGLLAGMGVLLALGFAAHGRSLIGRAAAASVLPLLLTTAYFTYSRGSALALAVGLVAAVALDPRRLAFVTTSLSVALPAGAAVWLAWRAPGLTDARATRALIADEGRQLAVALLLMTIASAAIVLAVGMIESRVRVPRAVRLVYGGLLACVVLALVAGTVAHHGGPAPLVDKAYRSFNREPPVAATTGEPADLNRRLARIGSTERVRYWRVARRQYHQHRWVGSGAGTYRQFWLRYRPVNSQARDAHSLYLETLAQLGWPGLALVVAFLAVPLAGAVRARSQPLAVGAFGAYAAYLVHTGIDWHWEMPIVTLIALLCGAALIVARDDRGRRRRAIPTRWRAAGVAATMAVAVFSAIGLVGNRSLAAATDAVDAGDFRAGEAHARKAAGWAPWSAQARHQLGRAQVGAGKVRQGRAKLREAIEMNSADWRIWYDLGIASSGRERRRAFVTAARLNPMEDDIEALREAGYRLPSPPRNG